MDGRARHVAIPASHQDQVVACRRTREVIAPASSRPSRGWPGATGPAISFQLHPEFAPAFAKALIEKRYDIVPDPDAAMASLDAPNDNARARIDQA